MKNIRTATILVPLVEATLTLRYTLSRGNDGSYAISLQNRTTGEQVLISDISRSPVLADRLFELLVRGSVTTITFRDVVEDFLAAI